MIFLTTMVRWCVGGAGVRELAKNPNLIFFGGGGTEGVGGFVKFFDKLAQNPNLQKKWGGGGGGGGG